FFLLCWLLLPGIVATFFSGDFTTFFVSGIGKGVLICLLACVLASTASWIPVVQGAAACGVILISIIHLIMPGIRAWWLVQLTPYVTQIQASWNLNLPPDQLKLLLDQVSHFATGIIVAGILAFDIVLLLMARAWQAVLFNPGGLSKEWQQLRLSYLYS